MKAVVVEVKDKFVAVLSDDGCISKIRNKNYTIGQEVKLGNNFKYLRFAASAAACLVLFATPVWAYLTPYSYVSLDINPSFEFSVNRFDRVLQVKAINDDVRNTADKIDVSKLKNKEIGEAVKDVITELKGQGYLNNAGEDGIVVAASSKSQVKTDKLTTTLKLAVEGEINVKSGNEKVMLAAAAPNIPLERAVADEETEETVKSEDAVKPDENKKNEIKEYSKEENKQVKEENKEKPIKENKKEEQKEEEQKERKSEEDNKNKSEKRDRKDKDFNVKVIEVSKEMIDKAKNNGVTPGKMELIEKLQLSAQSAGKSIESEQWLNKSVKDIMEKTKEYEKIVRCEENNKKKDEKSDKKDDRYEKKDDKSDKTDNKSNKDSDKENNDGKSKSREKRN